MFFQSLLLLAAPFLVMVTSSGCQSDADCLNGGGCREVQSGVMRCDCTSSYSGSDCSIECPILCYNGAKCVSDVDEHFELGFGDATARCECADGWFGSLCDIPVDTCPDGLQCFNGGACRPSTTGGGVYICNCPDTHDGTTCSRTEPTPSPTATSPPIQQFERCSICGPGRVVSKPNVVFAYPDQPAVPCGTLEAAGESGLIPLDQCPFLPPLVTLDCSCVVDSPTGSTDSESAPAPAPVLSESYSLNPGAIAGIVIATGTLGAFLIGLGVCWVAKSRNEVPTKLGAVAGEEIEQEQVMANKEIA